MYQIMVFVAQLVNLLVLAIVIRAILSWFMRLGGDPITRLLLDITEPILVPIRNLMSRLLPNMMIDFSPLVAILLLQFLARALLQAAAGY